MGNRTLTISHAPATGTLLHGTSKSDNAGETLRSVRHVAYWKWSSTLGCWYITRSRDRRVHRYQIDATAAALRHAGFIVQVELSDERRPVAEQEAERAQR